MKKRIVAGLLALAVSSAAHAVYLNPRGLGQVLLYPYYTVNAGQTTMISIVNTTPNGKALKMRMHEGYNGRDVLDFNIYLSPYDVWTAEIAQVNNDADTPPSMVTNDASCTVPVFNSVDLRNFDYTGANVDTGPTDNLRMREGHLDIIEMGEVTDAAHGSLTALTHGDNGVPANCAQLVQAWATGGYWSTDPTSDMSPPGGGLYGSESIIDVAQGTIYTIDATAIDGFSSTILHTASGELTPDLNSANDSAAGATVSAFVPVGNGMVEAKYQHPIDAVSALFMSDTLYNEYDVDPAVGAQSDWLLTFPTKRFYVDPKIVGNTALPPFDELFGQSTDGQSCAPFNPQVFNRDELTTSTSFCGVPPPIDFFACFETSILAIGGTQSVLGSQLSGVGRIQPPASFISGHINMSLVNQNDGCNTTPDASHALSAASNGYAFQGMPAIGFVARSYINANVSAGVLANYSGLLPHRSSVTCTTGTNPAGLCE